MYWAQRGDKIAFTVEQVRYVVDIYNQKYIS